MDSINVIDALMGVEGAKGRDSLLQQHNGSGNFGFRRGDWKLIHHPRGKTSNTQLRLSRVDVPVWALYDLSKDPAETTEVQNAYPEIFESMKKEMIEIIDSGRSRP